MTTTTEELLRILEGDDDECDDELELSDSIEFRSDGEDHDDNEGINWTLDITVPDKENFDEFISGVSPSVPLSSDSSELDIFEHFCGNDLVEKICYFTNKYHQFYVRHTDLRVYARLKRWQDVTVHDIYIFLALTMLFTRNKRLTIEEHWSVDPLLNSPIFHSIMCRDRYCAILAMLSFSEVHDVSNLSRLYKIEMMIDHARQKFRHTLVPGGKLCIDESIVPFKGRLVIKQYLPKKRNRFGIKLFVLCDVESGFIIDFIVYCGSQTQIEHVPNLGITGSVVTELVQGYYHSNRELYVDNWYSSPRLFLYLKQRGIYACGTVKSNRKHMPKFKKLKRGEIEAFSSPPLLALKWQDKKAVTMLSTIHDDKIVPSDNLDHFSGLPKLKPQCVIDYNKNMGSVDITDMMMSSIGCIRKTRKWYKKLGFHIIDLFMLNAFYLFRVLKNNKKHSFADFQLNVIRQLLEKNKRLIANTSPAFTSGTQSNPPRSLHIDALAHFPVRIPSGKSQRCKVCATKNKRSHTRYMCKTCNVYLCVDTCAAEYHR